MSLTDVLLVIAGVAWILGRRLLGELLEVKGLLVMPVVLTVVGSTQLGGTWSPAAIGFAGVGVALSIGLGLVRGTTVHLGRRPDGELWMRYRAVSVGLWVLNLAVKAALFPLEHAVSPDVSSAADRSILLSIGLGVLAETAVVLLRAMRSDGDIVWAKGEDGAPHVGNATFERIRGTVNSAAGTGRPLASDVRRWAFPERDW